MAAGGLQKLLGLAVDEFAAGCGHPQHGLHPNKMALVTSDRGKNAVPEHQMALITSGCARFRAKTPGGGPRAKPADPSPLGLKVTEDPQ